MLQAQHSAVQAHKQSICRRRPSHTLLHCVHYERLPSQQSLTCRKMSSAAHSASDAAANAPARRVAVGGSISTRGASRA